MWIGIGTTKDPQPGRQASATSCLDLQLDDDVSNRTLPTLEDFAKCLVYVEPSPYVRLLMLTLIGTPSQGRCGNGGGCETIVPFNAMLRHYGNDWPPTAYTMIGTQRLENFRAAILEVNRNHIPGAIIELGVWRGGAMILAAGVLKETGVKRYLYLYDAFESMPGYSAASNYLANSMKSVQSNFELFDVRDDHVHFEKGLFKDTVPAWKIESKPIAVLRVDGNFYDSYQDAMYHMYESVSVGGIVIFDDVMSHAPVQAFWLDFKKDQGVPEVLNRIDRHSAWFRKVHDVKLNYFKMHPPKDANKEKGELSLRQSKTSNQTNA